MEVYFPLFLLVSIVLQLATHTFSSSSNSSGSPSPSSSSRPFVTRLLHTQSPAYRRFNPNSSIEYIAYMIEKTSHERISFLNHAYEMKYKEKIIESAIVCSFVAEMQIGEPAVRVFPMMDTASSLLWIKDRNVVIGNSNDTDYNSDDSYTYFPLSCKNNYCTREVSGECGPHSRCQYFVRCGSIGTLAEENFHMGHPGEVVLYNIVFGAAINQLDQNRRLFQHDGILGLGQSDISLTMQLARRFGYARFSYCLGKINSKNISDPYSFGTSSSLVGDSTPFINQGLHYEVTLNGITVVEEEGEEARSLPIDSQSAFRTEYGTVFDSGSPLSYIVPDAYNALVYEVQKAVSNLGFNRVELPGWDLCYQANLKDVIGFPTFRFQFDGGPEMNLGIESLFYQLTPEAICLSVRNSDQFALGYGIYNLIGGFAQQNHHIGYDLEQKLVYIKTMDCQEIFNSNFNFNEWW